MATFQVVTDTIHLSANTPQSVDISLPATGGDWLWASLAVSGTVEGQAERYAIRVYSSDDEQMSRVSAGERYANALLAGAYYDRPCDGWNGLDTTTHPFFGVPGTIWTSIKAKQGVGGTLSLQVLLSPQSGWDHNDDYYLWQPAYVPAEATIRLVLTVTYGVDPAAPDPTLTRLACRHSVAALGDLALSVSHNTMLGYEYPQGHWLQVNVLDLSSRVAIDRYFIEVNRPHYESGVGCVVLPTGKTIVSYLSHDEEIVYLASRTMGLGGVPATGSMSIPGSSPIPIEYRAGVWEVQDDLGWPAPSVVDSCLLPDGTPYALFAWVEHGTCWLAAGELDAHTGHLAAMTVLASGWAAGSKEYQYDHYVQVIRGGAAGLAYANPHLISIIRYPSDELRRAIWLPGQPAVGLDIIGTTGGYDHAGGIANLPPGVFVRSGGLRRSGDRGYTWETLPGVAPYAAVAWRHHIVSVPPAPWYQPSGPAPRPATYTISSSQDYGQTWSYHVIGAT